VSGRSHGSNAFISARVTPDGRTRNGPASPPCCGRSRTRNPLCCMRNAEREGFEPSIPLDAVYRICRKRTRPDRTRLGPSLEYKRDSQTDWLRPPIGIAVGIGGLAIANVLDA
jgi:hypothetical protein